MFNADCSNGYFGYDCGTPCSENCLNNTICDRINGSCLNGCKDGYRGENCNLSKHLNIIHI